MASRKATFKELARRIVAADRDALKHQEPQNTIGAISSALEWAYKAGVEVGSGRAKPIEAQAHPSGAIDWIEIPSSSRQLLELLTIKGWGEPQDLDYGAYALAIMPGPPKKYAFLREALDPHKPPDLSLLKLERGDVVSGKGVGPLLKLGLLSETREAILEVTEKGRETAKLYWERRRSGDPTLPISMTRR